LSGVLARDLVSGEAALDAFYGALLDDDAEELYDRAPCGYLSTTPDGTLIKANETFLTLTGYRREELIGRRTFAELLSAGGRMYHETHFAPMLRMQGRAREIAFEIVTSSGDRLPVLVNAVLERDEAGAPIVVRTAIFDATDRREYELELLRAKERAERSEARAHALARTLQQTLMPPVLPAVAGLEIAAEYRAAGEGAEVGGDFYDVFEVGADDWVLAIGDVCGKGVEAAIVTALARYTIRAACVRYRDAREVLATLNEVLLHHDAKRFCTVLLTRWRRRDDGWIVTVASGGHPLPFVVRGGVATAVGRPGALLGVLSEARVDEVDVDLHAGDVFVAYTDGVTEARRDGRFYGLDAAETAIARLASEQADVARRLVDEVVEFQRGVPRDDVAIVAVTVMQE
jgi:phosphoserine phosphatase RsbU/P